MEDRRAKIPPAPQFKNKFQDFNNPPFKDLLLEQISNMNIRYDDEKTTHRKV